MSWQKDNDRKTLTTNNLASNILCNRHNNTLHSLDDIAIRLFNSFDRIDHEFYDQAAMKADRAFLFSGHDIERWMLKTLCGCVMSGNASSQSGPIRDWKPTVQWMRILFGGEPFPPKWGLYFSGNIGETHETNRSFAFNLISNGGVPYGAIITLNAKKFILVMANPPEDMRGTILENYIYRPSQLVMQNRHCQKVILLAWDVSGPGKSIVINCQTKAERLLAAYSQREMIKDAQQR